MTLATASPEALFEQRVIPALAPHFQITQQVWGTHPTGKRLRIDAIAVPHDPHNWSRPDIALGIEFKAPTDRPEERRDRKDNAKIISQCIDYSLTSWDGFGLVPIFFCPGFVEIRSVVDCESDPFWDEQDYQEGFRHGIGYFMAGIMGQNNVGELTFSHRNGWAFVMNGRHHMWIERDPCRPGGVREGRHNKLTRSVGSR